MNDTKRVAELLTTGSGTEGSLLVARKIHDQIIDEAAKSIIPRSEAAIVFGRAQVPGSSIDINRMTENSMDVRLVGEGAEIPLDNALYNNLNVKPAKYGVTIRITSELMEDSMFDLLSQNVRIAGRRLAENENSLVVTALDAAANTVAGGATITIANITRAMQHLEDADYNPTSYFVGMEVLNDLRNIDTFVEADKLGSREMLTQGFVGNLYGMRVIRVSTNAGMTATSSYVTDKSAAYVIVEKRPITVENFRLAEHDMSGAAVTHRIAVSALRTNAIAKITTS